MNKMFDDLHENFSTLLDAGLKYDQSYAVAAFSYMENFMSEHADSSYILVYNFCDAFYKKCVVVYEKFVVSLFEYILIF